MNIITYFITFLLYNLFFFFFTLGRGTSKIVFRNTFDFYTYQIPS